MSNILRIAVVVVLLFLLVEIGSAATLTVNASGGADYTRIQDAVDHAFEGDTIEVFSGIYYENYIWISKQLILKGIDNGNGKPIVDARGEGIIFYPLVNGITIDGFAIINTSSYGIRAMGIMNSIIINNSVSNVSNGMLFEYCNNNIIKNNIIFNNSDSGIIFFNSENNNIINNRISNSWVAFQLSNSNNNTIDDNNIDSNGAGGIRLYNSNKNNIINNRISDNPTNSRAIELSDSNNNTINDNKLNNNNDGIVIWDSNNTIINNNIVYNNRFGGIVIIRSNRNSLNGNIEYNNLVGIQLSDSSSDNMMTNNNIYNSSMHGFALQNMTTNNTLNYNNIYSNNQSGIAIMNFPSSTSNQGFNKINRNNIYSNDVGISISRSEYNIVIENNITSNTDGIQISPLSANNLFYNNFLSNPNNYIGISNRTKNNNWNINKTLDTNIIGGNNIGGNFWAYPNGTGFSQTCINTDGDGICDSPYVLDANNTDYLPLTSLNTFPPIRFINGTVKDNSTGNNLTGVTVSANLTLRTTTNATGFYSFAVTEGTYNLTATYDITYYTNITTVSTVGQAVAWQDIELLKKPTGNITGSVTSV